MSISHLQTIASRLEVYHSLSCDFASCSSVHTISDGEWTICENGHLVTSDSVHQYCGTTLNKELYKFLENVVEFRRR